jgi:hypothetical protein
MPSPFFFSVKMFDSLEMFNSKNAWEDALQIPYVRVICHFLFIENSSRGAQILMTKSI